jgi:hypothetical protein
MFPSGSWRREQFHPSMALRKIAPQPDHTVSQTLLARYATIGELPHNLPPGDRTSCSTG